MLISNLSDIFTQVRLYGSSLSGFGLRSANVNLDLQITADMKPHLVLITALEVLQENPEYTQVTQELRQIHFEILDKYILQFETNIFCK